MSLETKTSIILSTQRIEEADSICDQVAIMVNGEFKAYGSPSKLKAKYSQQSHILQVELINEDNREEISSEITAKMPFLINVSEINRKSTLRRYSHNSN